jgi:hypothetical protein
MASRSAYKAAADATGLLDLLASIFRVADVVARPFVWW